ncbi:MAG: PQQ-binding-like beta-propeller repeat protein [Kiritimatiellae bacterium]|nr:PQQ-binding-like beta-propeller repeat protein [Kiritimatiellia bacterium]
MTGIRGMLIRILRSSWPACVVLAVVAAFLSARTATADDWPQFRGLNRDGHSAETGWLQYWPPQIVWTQSIGIGYSAPSISEGRLYTMGEESDAVNTNDVLYCFDALSGGLIWTQTYSIVPFGDENAPGPRAAPTIDGDYVYTHSHQGDLKCWHKITGSNIWSQNVNFESSTYGHCSSPLVVSNVVVVNNGHAGSAVNKDTGAIVWTNLVDGQVGACASPVTYTTNGVPVVVTYGGEGPRGINALTGAEVWWWAGSGGTENYCDPVIFDGDKVLFAQKDWGEAALIQMGTGEAVPVWAENWDFIPHCATPVLVGDHVYGVSWGEIMCLDLRAGVTNWGETGHISGEDGAIIAADGKLIVLDDDGDLGIIQASSTAYTEECAFVQIFTNANNQEWYSAPVLSNGKLYLRSRQGTLVCLRLGDTPVPKVGMGTGDWRFKKGIAEASTPASVWRNLAFDDSGWDTGDAPFGYGDTNIWTYGTTLTDMQNSYWSLFLRKPFTVDSPALVSRIDLEAWHDDGFIMWINGEEVARVNVDGVTGEFMPYNTFSPLSLGNASNWTHQISAEALPALVTGTNMLAVHCFNASADSSDFTMDFAVEAVEESFYSIEDDEEQDGMLDSWETTQIGSTSESGDADHDGDGLSNMGEYIAGTHPASTTSYFDVTSVLSNGEVHVSFPTILATDPDYAGYDRYYALEYRTNLVGDAWLGVSGYTSIEGLGQTVVYTNAAGNTPFFYRCKVWLQPE